MTVLQWNSIGDRLFETGIDRAVLYTTDGRGIAWNGLTSVKDSSSGGDTTPYYLDGIAYVNVPSREEITGTIEAFTYPEEFGVHDGTFRYPSGLVALQQRRRPFALSYRTRVGNDVDGTDHGYKIHIIYNVTASPSDKTYSSINENPEPLSFSWDFTTTPKKPKTVTGIAPLAHVIIESTKTAPNVLRYIEEQLYGTYRSQSRLVPINELFEFFNNPVFIFSVFANPDTGLSQLIMETDGTGDLIGDSDEGLYSALSETRLTATATPGLYTLGT